ncbi:unnamed protein product [Peronospora effusa]|nr:unnamed protein product [Peronospora effusa]
MGYLEATFQVLTVSSSIMVRLSPWPDFQRIYKTKNTGEVQILPVVMLFANCVDSSLAADSSQSFTATLTTNDPFTKLALSL